MFVFAASESNAVLCFLKEKIQTVRKVVSAWWDTLSSSGCALIKAYWTYAHLLSDVRFSRFAFSPPCVFHNLWSKYWFLVVLVLFFFHSTRLGLTLHLHHWFLQTSSSSCLPSFHLIIFMVLVNMSIRTIAMTQTGGLGPFLAETPSPMGYEGHKEMWLWSTSLTLKKSLHPFFFFFCREPITFMDIIPSSSVWKITVGSLLGFFFWTAMLWVKKHNAHFDCNQLSARILMHKIHFVSWLQ